MLATDLRAPREIARRGHDHATLALHGLDQKCRRIGRDRARQCVGVAIGNRQKAGRKRAEPVAVLRLG